MRQENINNGGLKELIREVKKWRMQRRIEVKKKLLKYSEKIKENTNEHNVK